RKIQKCDPKPAEIWIHIDQADGTLEGVLHENFPDIRVLTSPIRMGPGGGRHRCLLACTTPYAVSFDDDSYPIDADFFAKAERLFTEHSQVAVFGASIWCRDESAKTRATINGVTIRNRSGSTKARAESLVLKPSYIACG